jgi:hypothetical protein
MSRREVVIKFIQPYEYFIVLTSPTFVDHLTKLALQNGWPRRFPTEALGVKAHGRNTWRDINGFFSVDAGHDALW